MLLLIALFLFAFQIPSPPPPPTPDPCFGIDPHPAFDDTELPPGVTIPPETAYCYIIDSPLASSTPVPTFPYPLPEETPVPFPTPFPEGTTDLVVLFDPDTTPTPMVFDLRRYVPDWMITPQ